MTEAQAKAEKLRDFLIGKANDNPNWAKGNTKFVCPASLAQVSDLSQAELQKKFDGAFDAFVARATDKPALQQMIANDVRYAISRLPDKNGQAQILPHIHINHVFATKEARGSFAIIEPSRELIPENSFNSLTVLKFGAGSNQAQQLTNMFWQLRDKLALQVGDRAAALIVENELFFKSKKNPYCLTDLGKNFLEQLVGKYVPGERPISAMGIEALFNYAAQKFDYSVFVSEEAIARFRGKKDAPIQVLR